MEEMKNGSIRIADEVIADIAIKAAQDVDGVANIHQRRILNNAKNFMSSRGSFVKGVTLYPSESGLDLTIQINIIFGSKVQKVCATVQREVAESVADMTGMDVRFVNVSVVGVVSAKPHCKKVSK